MSEFKKCTNKNCKNPIKELTEENFRLKKDIRYKNGLYWYPWCRECENETHAEWYNKNKDDPMLKQMAMQRTKSWRQKNKKRRNKQERNRRKSDPIYALRTLISKTIDKLLKRNSSSKNGRSCWKYLGYTPQELWDHLMNHPEKEWWMTKENRGIYNKKYWDNNDPSTWTWQIDHIIPQSTFNYKSMDDPEFKACWALSNLRPYSAKQNILDGASRKRHKNHPS